MEITIANHAHVTSRPVQVRSSSQPTGLRSIFQRIQRLKNFNQITGVQRVRFTFCLHNGGGSSRQLRRICHAAKTVAPNNTSSENPALSSIVARNWLTT